MVKKASTRTSVSTYEPNAPAYQSEYHWKEYEILQDKIDKIGAFRFQIKNWVVVVVSTAATSGYYAKVPWWVFPCYLLVVFAFWLFEMKQKGFQDAFGNRAKALEAVLRRNNKYVFSPKQRRRLSEHEDLMAIDPFSIGDALYLNEVKIKRKKCWSKLMGFSHHLFYVVVGALVLCFCLAAAFRTEDSTAQKIEFSSALEFKDQMNPGNSEKNSPPDKIGSGVGLPPRSDAKMPVPSNHALGNDPDGNDRGIEDQTLRFEPNGQTTNSEIGQPKLHANKVDVPDSSIEVVGKESASDDTIEGSDDDE